MARQIYETAGRPGGKNLNFQNECERNPGLMEVPNHQNKIRVFVQFDEPRPVLVINSEGVKFLIQAF